MSDEAHPHEIIIIKRHPGGHDEGHHGGAWKIAYADFVTAMMAFFLVMWLLSANEKTKSAVVKFFNPVQLVDATPQPPGLSDPSEKSPDAKKKTAPKAEGEEKEVAAAPPPPKDKPVKVSEKDEKAADSKGKEEAALMKDPYAVLAELASKDAKESKEAPPTPTPSKGASEGSKAPTEGLKGGSGAAGGAAGAKGGEAFRDPFEPVSTLTASDVGAAELAPQAPQAPQVPQPVPPAPATRVQTQVAPEPSATPLPADPAARGAELKNRIDTLLKAVAAASPGPEPKIDVKVTPEGVLIALTDDAKFSMFGSASAQPSPRTVTLMEKLGKLIKVQKGRVVIRGFTDSRKYKSDTYDNWRLSSARAHMAHYMLARGGLDDARIERIEGYADRQPRNAKDPESPENRRIEILLRDTP